MELTFYAALVNGIIINSIIKVMLAKNTTIADTTKNKTTLFAKFVSFGYGKMFTCYWFTFADEQNLIKNLCRPN